MPCYTCSILEFILHTYQGATWEHFTTVRPFNPTSTGTLSRWIVKIKPPATTSPPPQPVTASVKTHKTRSMKWGHLPGPAVQPYLPGEPLTGALKSPPDSHSAIPQVCLPYFPADNTRLI